MGDLFGVGQIAASTIGAQTASQGMENALEAQQAALSQWLSVNVPDPAQQRIELQRYQSTGQLSPQLQTAFDQSQTGLKGMQIDPASRAAEIQALSQMQNIGSKGGLDAQALQQEQQGINQSNTNAQGQRGAIMQNFAARGTGGSGAELASLLQAQQGDSNSAAASGMSAAASAQQRALQAMTASGQLGGQINSQDYTQAANAAAAQDSINRFNTQQQQNVSNSNVSTLNNAQEANLKNAQDIANKNTGVANQQETYNKGLLQQQFEDQAQLASGKANAEAGVANQYALNGQNMANTWAGIGSAIGQAGSEYDQKSNADDANTAKNASNPSDGEDEGDSLT